jgi:hypothetical protein
VRVWHYFSAAKLLAKLSKLTLAACIVGACASKTKWDRLMESIPKAAGSGVFRKFLVVFEVVERDNELLIEQSI